MKGFEVFKAQRMGTKVKEAIKVGVKGPSSNQSPQGLILILNFSVNSMMVWEKLNNS